ncbi:tyrosyl-tRNA deacylase [Lysinibacillus contaminans]|uniref:Tyrosyl-tRNA deacylase n=1 Tax=Lysinibacillus contaminans TaxID=1293441 RepID=A0ABR5JZ14_9BACI|nr:DUF2642 domain-containing protein [Lysinibacillus contaminans]KOS67895.1 tyrosyl-tRNA deacylase [Lysinibacillus contaminans]
MSQMGSVSNPYLYETVRMLVGQPIVVQTVKNVQQGMLTSVLPDHIVVEVCQVPFFIRMEEIVWVTLAVRRK